MSVAFAPSGVGQARFVIVDQHPLMVEGLKARLERMPTGAALHYAGPSVFSAVQAARSMGCDCAIVDIEIDGPSRTPDVITAFSMYGIPVLALAAQASRRGMEQAMIAGASAYVDKRSDPARIAAAVRAVLAGGTWVPDELEDHRSARACSITLSVQEERSLVLYASGMTLETVARRMGIAPSTVKHYLDRVRQKCAEAGLAARTKIELHAVARSQGLLP